MPLTPADIHHMSFRQPPLGKRGYDEVEVDALMDTAEQEFTRLRAENQALREQLERDAAGPEQELAALAAKLKRLIAEQAEAEQHARRLWEQLERARGTEPEQPPAAVLAMAQRTADEYLRDAEREAEKLRTAAQTKADRMISEAGIEACTIDSDARHRHAQALSRLTEQREATLADIDRLRLLAQAQREQVYRQVSDRLLDLTGPPRSSSTETARPHHRMTG